MTAPAASRLRVRAPELAGRGWLNTGGRDVTLADLRGRIVVLDFWTFCCVNCLHVLDELRPLEERYDDALVLVGVHSPKFEHEADADALAAAVERYAVHHPVLDDPDLVTWKAYTARAWPTLVVIDPEGYIVASLSGEGHAHGLSVLIDELVEEHTAKGTLRRGDAPYVAPPPATTALRFPGKAAALPDGSFLVSDTAHHQLVHLESDLVTERARLGGPGTFNEPQGVLALPADVAGRVGYDVVVADSVHHQVKGVRLADGAVLTLAGTGQQLRERSGSGPALRQDLSTPWDVAWFIDRVVIAMAGVHQLWVLHLAADPARQHGRRARRHVRRGHPRRGRPRRVVRPALGPGHLRRRAPPLGRRLRDLRAALADAWTSRASRSPPTSGRACSTSATGTAPPTRRCCSTRSGSPSCPTARWRSATPTTAPSAGSTPSPVRSARWPRGCASPATRSSRSTVRRPAWSWSSRPGTS